MTKILIVDDEKNLAEALGDILELEGYQVKPVLDGYKAIEAVKNTHYDLVLMDIRLPGINGVDTFLKIKEINPLIKVIMMTGFFVEDMIEEALKQGAYACIHKPFDLEKVILLIKEILQNNRKIILIVEDNLETRENLFDILKEDYRVCQATDGEEALVRLKEKYYDCILLDLKLPKIDGITILKEAKIIHPDTVVIVMTGYDLPLMLKEVERLNAYAYLKKPVDPEKLLALLKEVFN
ncbi:MAG: response regulator [bacterium]|nr:response regulator [bacterium]